MGAINLHQQFGDMSVGEIILGVIIVAAVFAIALAWINVQLSRDKNNLSELHSRDRYAVADQIRNKQLTANKPKHGRIQKANRSNAAHAKRLL